MTVFIFMQYPPFPFCTVSIVQSVPFYRMCQKMTQLVFVRTSSNLHQIC